MYTNRQLDNMTNLYPDYRLQKEQEMYEYFKSHDYSKERNWKLLFSSQGTYLKACTEMSHPFHKEAMQIRKNRLAFFNKKHTVENEEGDIINHYLI